MPPPLAPARRRWFALATLLALLVFVTRWPLLGAGFGTDFDSWLLADAAKWIHMSGNYHASRRPGYPVSEVLFALVHDLGFRGLNGVSAVACAACAVLVATLVRGAGALRAWLTGALVAAVPLVYVVSTSTIDYLPSLALLLGALVCVRSARLRSAAFLLGLAIGARGANAPLLVALGAVVWMRHGRAPALRFALWSAGLAALCYLPVLLTEGPSYFVPVVHSRPPLDLVLERATIETWGQLGSAAFALGFLGALPGLRRRWRAGEPGDRELLVALTLIVLLSGLVFVILPLEAGYLVPAAVAGCALVGWHLRAPLLAPLVALVAVSGFLDIGGTGGGVVGRDHARRERDMAQVVEVLRAVARLDEPAVVLTGHAHARVVYYAGFLQHEPGARVRFVQSIPTQERARFVVERGESLRYLAGVDRWLRETRGLDLAALGARPLLQADEGTAPPLPPAE